MAHKSGAKSYPSKPGHPGKGMPMKEKDMPMKPMRPMPKKGK